MGFTHIEPSDLTGKGVVGLPDTPNLNTTEMQEKFDEIALDVIVPKFNDLADELDDSGLDVVVSSDDITNIRLNSDRAIEVSEDGGTTWSGTASSGHRIMDGSGTIYTQRPRLQFSNNVTITDDNVNGATVLYVQPGEKGERGAAATITVGDVESGAVAEIENVGSATDAVFNFTLPKGDDGTAASVSVGTVTSGATASISARGTSSDVILDFVLPKGDQGDPGTGLTLLGVYATYADLIAAHPTGTRGNAYYVGDDTSGVVYLWDPDTTAWVNVGELKGPKGDTGATPSFSIGTVTTGATSAVSVSGTTDYPVLNFTLEKGDKGDQGNAATISIGGTTTLPTGEDATVTNGGSPTAAVLYFGIPTGPQGPQGNPTTVNGKTGNMVTLYGSDIALSSLDATKVDAAISALATAVASVKWSSAESVSAGATSVTITDADIATTSVVEPFIDDGTGDAIAYTSVTVTTGQAVVAFDALANNASVKVRITN